MTAYSHAVGGCPPNATFPYRVQPASDDCPFYNNVRYLGSDPHSRPERVTEEIEELTSKTWYLPWIPIGYIARLAVLAEAAIFAALFLLLPLWKVQPRGIESSWQRLSLVYFMCLGLGFIWIEIVLLKSFVLFLGSPVYSIAVVLFAMLVFAGLGSLCSERLTGPLSRQLGLTALGLLVVVGGASVLYPLIMNHCLGWAFPLRVAVVLALIGPIGLILGMPFPIGLRFFGDAGGESVPWAWAANGYATVVGVSTSGFVAMQVGFTALLWLSTLVYLGGFATLLASRMFRVNRSSGQLRGS